MSKDIECAGPAEALVMPDYALIHAIGYARLKGAKTEHIEIMAHQISYLMVQLRVIANTYDPDGDDILRKHVKQVLEACNKNLSRILDASQPA